MASAYPQGYEAAPSSYGGDYKQPAYDYKPEYKPEYKPGYANGRVKIQVYRGPNKEYGSKGYDSTGYGKGYDDGAFAPWGFYVTQPEDDKAYYGSKY